MQGRRFAALIEKSTSDWPGRSVSEPGEPNMFEQATLSAGPAARRIWSTCLGVTGQALVISGMILTPMIWPEILPKAQTFLAGPIIAPPPTGPAVRPRGSATSPRPIFQRPTSAVFREPSAVPVRVQMLDEPAAGLAGSIAGIPNGGPQGIEGGVLGAVLTTGSQIAPPPRVIEPRAEPPKPAAPASTIKLRVSPLDFARPPHRGE